MLEFRTRYKKKEVIIALGSESAGNFCIFKDGKIYYHGGFGNLLDGNNYSSFNDSIYSIFKKDKLKPTVILADKHPLFLSGLLAEDIAKKYKAKLIKVQHHVAHIFAALGEDELINKKKIQNKIVGIACDGTGYGDDGSIWGGEVMTIDLKNKTYKRVGFLEPQTLAGGEQAIRQPARMLISILVKFLSKEKIYEIVKKYYQKNEFELLYNQIQQRFNCLSTTSTGRVLDSVAVLLGFFNKNNALKHEATAALADNATLPYALKPRIMQDEAGNDILSTTHLFKFLIANLYKDKKRLSATAQKYITEGLLVIAQKKSANIYAAGGIIDNKIIVDYFRANKVIVNNQFARGDNALAFGQMVYYLKIFC